MNGDRSPMDDRPEGNDTLVGKGPCPKCGREKTLATYADGHTHCYGAGCGYFTTAEGGPKLTVVDGGKPAFEDSRESELIDPDWSSPQNREGLPARRLRPEALRKLGIFRAGFKGGVVQAYPYHDQQGRMVAQKLRLPDKSFPVLKGPDYPGRLGQCQLFGQAYFGDRFDRQVVITEGELDAASVAQVLEFKTAVVSVGTGAAAAAENLKANYLWLDRFAEIILWFDTDEAGQLATEECAKLFKVGKVRVAKASGFKLDGKTPCKDASDMLQASHDGDIKACVYAATAWRPRGIVNAAAKPSDTDAPEGAQVSYGYPPIMANLQDMSGGIWPGDVTYHVAGTGVGKSTNIREIIYHLIEQGVKVCVMSFEDTIKDVKLGIMSIPASERLALRPVPTPDDLEGRAQYNALMRKWHEVAFGSGMAELFDPETAQWSMEAIMGYGRYAAKALDCKVCVVEPLSFVAAGVDIKVDLVKALDSVAAELAKNAKELDLAYLVSHHLRRTMGVPHEEGAPTSLNEIRSSGGLANFATGVIGWERNSQAEGEGWRVTQSRIIKPFRRTGRSGLADVLYYGENGRLIKSPIPFPPIGKPETQAGGGQDQAHGAGPFGDARDY